MTRHSTSHKHTSQRGATAASTALLIGLISVVAIVAVQNTGNSVNALFTNVGGSLESATEGTLSSGSSPSPAPSASQTIIGIANQGSYRQFADGSNAASCNDYLNPDSGYSYTGDTGSGVYRIDAGGNASTVETWCDMTADGGGWTLVAANAASSSTIAGGTGRNSSSYYLNATGINGTPDPAGDFVIGPEIDDMSFTEVRISINNGGTVDLKFPCSTRLCVTDTGSSGVVTDIGSPSLTFYDDLRSGNSGRYCKLDSVALDASLNANSNQSTLGGSCGLASNGDPSGGTYVGHGGTEGSFEGYYRWTGGSQGSGSFTYTDASQYATWVR